MEQVEYAQHSKRIQRKHENRRQKSPVETRPPTNQRSSKNNCSNQQRSIHSTDVDGCNNVTVNIMERVKRTDRIKLRYSNFDSEDDNEYHVAEEEEDLKNFQICPAKPNQSNTEYADREPRKPMPTETGQSWEPSSWDIPPRPPKRPIPGNPAPAVNRDLKPSRRPKSPLDGRSMPLGLTEKISPVPPRSGKHQPKDQRAQFKLPVPQSTPTRPKAPIPENLPANTGACSQQKRASWRDVSPGRQASDTTGDFSSGFSRDPTQSSHRYSLDLETQDLNRDFSKRVQTIPGDATSGIRLHHEWPQTKEDKNNSSYTPQSKPLEVSDEEDWYVGSFSRVEAEHALHLVNREGAFLVRDCSKNTSNEPFVLVVFYDKRVFNIQIRFSEATRKYTLGTGLRTNDLFDSVADIIKFHSIFPIVLIDGRSSAGPDRAKRTCVLMYPVTKKDMAQLLG